MMAKRNRRRGITQSKWGCFTCKARKVRCDEEGDPCKNCRKGNRTCSWPARPGAHTGTYLAPVDTNTRYQTPLTPSTAVSSEPSPGPNLLPLDIPTGRRCSSPTLRGRFATTPEDDGLINRACNIVLGHCVDDFSFLHDAVKGAIFSYDTLSTSTKHAAGALEAAKKHLGRVTPSESPVLASHTYSEYSAATSHLRMELKISKGTNGHNSIHLTHLFLMVVDLLVRYRHEATIHFSFLKNIVTERMWGQSQQLEVLWRSFEIHKMISADSVIHNEIPAIAIVEMQHVPYDIRALGIHLIRLVHASQAFITKVALGLSHGQTTSQDEYRLFINAITETCSNIERRLENRPQHLLVDADALHLMRLQCLALYTQIELSCLFGNNEYVFDEYAPQFQKIISNAEHLLFWQETYGSDTTAHFSLQLGTIQPLYFAAMKYRDLSWRQRAIVCLHKSGQEGPLRGSVLAAAASRCAAIERDWPFATTGLQAYRHVLESYINNKDQTSVPTEGRITACRFIDDSSVVDFGLPVDSDTTRTAMSLSQSKIMLIWRLSDTPALPARVLSCWNQETNTTSLGLFDGTLSPEHWGNHVARIAF